MKILTFGEIMLRLKAPGHEHFFPVCKSSVAHPTSNTRDFFIKICRGQIYFLSAAFFFV